MSMYSQDVPFFSTARCSLGVAALGGHVYAVAGSDGYRCLNSAERYDPITNLWSFIAPLKINRRGLGLVEHNGEETGAF